MNLERVVMVASSYPRFEGDTVGTFMAPIAHGVAARGHEVHVVLPWHPRWQRPLREGGVTYHLFRYAPAAALNVFGYAGALEADERLRLAAMAAAPAALFAGWRRAQKVARDVRATVLHGHWVVPGGAIAAAAAGDRPLVVSLHGSDAFVAERHRIIGAVARRVLARAGAVTACSEDLRRRAVTLGAHESRTVTVPYGVDVGRFRPNPSAREASRSEWGVPPDAEVVFALGRLVRKKGFEYLLEAVAALAGRRPRLRLVLAGEGDLAGELRGRIAAHRIEAHVVLTGTLSHSRVPSALAASDVVAVPSVRDDAGNVDGLPNVVLEALASGTPVVATSAGGIAAVVRDGQTGLLVGERDVAGLAAALERLLDHPAERARLGAHARAWAVREAGWDGVARAFERAYAAARLPLRATAC